MSNVDYVAMSEEDFEASLANPPGDIEQETSTEVSEPSGEELEQSHENDVDSTQEAQEEHSNDVEEESDTEVEESSDEVETQEEEESVEESETEETETESDEPTNAELDKLFAPFKASGMEMKVDSVDEALQLMKMGVDYQKKMSGFKPHRKTIKMLQDHGIDADKLNHLIDIQKGNPQAIAQLLKDNKVDPNDLDVEEDSNYTPSDYSVSDKSVDLDDVLSRIQDTPSFSTTSDVISNQWDEASKKVLYQTPSLIENLNTHIANGTYQRVMQEVTKARMLGQLQGLTDYDAYNAIGSKLAAQATPPAKVVKTKPKVSNTNTEQKLRTSTKPRSTKAVAPKYDYANMSDAEFEKQL